MSFREVRVPRHVEFDLTTFFELPDLPSRARIGVVTDMKLKCDDDFLYVKGGVSDGGLHDTLAAKVGPAKNKFMRLPPEMYSEKGMVSGWNMPTAEKEDKLILTAGQVDGTERLESTFERRETDRCLGMAALALGWLLEKTPEEIGKMKDPHKLIFGSPLLAKLRRKIGNRIFE